MAAAREAVRRYGFTGAGTRAIATAAGTSETVLFRHFAGKEALFDEAVCEHWVEQLDGLVLDGDLEARITALCRFFAGNRELVLTLLEAERLPGRPRDTLRRPLAAVRDELARGDFVTLTLAMIVGATVLDGWVFSGRHLDPDTAVAEITTFVTNGLA